LEEEIREVRELGAQRALFLVFWKSEKREKENFRPAERSAFFGFGFIVWEPTHEENETKQLKECDNKNSVRQAPFLFSVFTYN